ncbi:MAG: hypothetical protein K1000chlam2_00057, partial [Chlamydiae bacterium]|nr:hypothetical protein [Chlamydiota bacterium]
MMLFACAAIPAGDLPGGNLVGFAGLCAPVLSDICISLF